MAFDLAKTNLSKLSEDGYEHTVVLPNGEETDWVITVRGTESPVIQKHIKKIIIKQVREDQLIETSKKRKKEFDYEETIDSIIESAAVRIIDWKGLEEDGKVVPFSEDTAKRVLREHRWVCEQIVTASEETSNFL